MHIAVSRDWASGDHCR